MDYLSHCSSPLGPITLASDGEALTGLWFDGQKHFGATLSPQRMELDLPVLQEARRWLDLYFGGRDPGPVPPLAPLGSAYRQKVWKSLLEIPYGCTVTYARLAGLIPTSPRAVASMAPDHSRAMVSATWRASLPGPALAVTAYRSAPMRWKFCPTAW